MRAVRGRRVLAAFAAVLLGLVVIAPSGAMTPQDWCKYCTKGQTCALGDDGHGGVQFNGCCPAGGTVCHRGNVSGACCVEGVCDENTGTCPATCPAGTRQCTSGNAVVSSKFAVNNLKSLNDICVPDCTPPKVWEPFSCSCITPCSAGREQCGPDCCPLGEECSVPAVAARNLPMLCCPKTPFGKKGAVQQVDGACGQVCASS